MYSGINSQLDKIVKTDIVSVYIHNFRLQQNEKWYFFLDI